MSVPAFSDIPKSANDLLNKDFYHAAAAVLEVKLKSPNGVAVTTKGTSAHDGPINGSVEGKKGLSNGISLQLFSLMAPIRKKNGFNCNFILLGVPGPPEAGGMGITGLMRTSTSTGITVTESWNTANVLNTKVELDNTFTKGLKAELSSVFAPSKGNKGQKLNLTFKQPAFQTRAFFDYSAAGNLTAVVDGVVGHEGFLVGGEAGYDVQKAAITRYSAAVGYQTPLYSAAITATNNLNVFTASYYQKVNAAVETGAKASWDAKAGSAVGIELASKYKLDPLSFAKAKINDRGIASLAYNTKINQGFTFGIGASLDTQKLNEAGHKIGASFTFEG
ncbi:Outer mitochondrial membrane protein porin protein [Neofusicoccum parvum]|uniref:Mitochondrial porin n=3 Tax=Neofusicoccum TaxID=407951 RepID=A0ABR3STX7_9PEZI|nr:putative outer mitochondrial membrane protein porin protein [Neofusicoccum parvum UCRNP2]GME28101.1 Outer mitochondrial membrane protein porin protein [Neofusicoccum parvum]GME63750.1 Outer mitochondrial membrane protein porin protein [Neofusicoccum parvum]